MRNPILRNKKFRALWAAQTGSTFGDALSRLTLILLITQRTHSVAAVGGLAIVLATPSIGLGLFAGVYVDRWDRRRIMIASDTGRALLLGTLALLALTTAGTSLLTIYLIAFLQAGIGTFFDPARAALTQLILPEQDQLRANSLVATTTVIGELAGTALAGLFVATLHSYWPSFAIDALTFLCSAALTVTIRRTPSTPAEPPSSTFTAIRTGFRALRASPTLIGLLVVFSALTFALSPLAVLLTPYVVTTLHLSPGWLGLIQAGDTVGNILGGTLVALAARRIRPRLLILGGMFLLAALIAGFAGLSTVAGLTLGYFVFGLLTVAIQSGIGALTQAEVDNALMGRFIGLLSIVPGVVSVLAMAFSGTAGAVLGIRTVLLLSGAVLAMAGLAAVAQFRRPGCSATAEVVGR